MTGLQGIRKIALGQGRMTVKKKNKKGLSQERPEVTVTI
jgi:hypothetical protein